MAIKMRTTGGGGNFTPLEPIPQGNHLGILYQILEIGTCKEEYQGETKEQYKVALTWELPELTHEFEDKESGDMVEKPRVISKDYTLSAHEKAALRLMIQSWRGKNLTDDEAASFDLTKLLGKPCLINVVHNTKGDKTYANIAAVTAVPKSMPIPQQYNESRYLEYDNWNWELFNSLPEWIRTRIEATPEFKALPKPSTKSAHKDGLPAPKRDTQGNVTPVSKPAPTWKAATQKQKVELEQSVSADYEPEDLPF